MKKSIFVLFILGLMAPVAALAETGQMRWNSLDRGSVACSDGYRNVRKEQERVRNADQQRTAEQGVRDAGSAR